jgi:hypothetical protein
MKTALKWFDCWLLVIAMRMPELYSAVLKLKTFHASCCQFELSTLQFSSKIFSFFLFAGD